MAHRRAGGSSRWSRSVGLAPARTAQPQIEPFELAANGSLLGPDPCLDSLVTLLPHGTIPYRT